MARLYSDENFDVQAMKTLRDWGHDTMTTQDAGQANQRIPDYEVLAFATKDNRAIVTFDRRDYFHLHKTNAAHAGIIACTYNPDSHELAEQIHKGIEEEDGYLINKFIRIYRPNS